MPASANNSYCNIRLEFLLSSLLSVFDRFCGPWYSDCAMPRVNIVKQFKTESGQWVLRSIPKKPTGHYDWSTLPDGDYFIEWRENGRRRREPAGRIASEALEAQRRMRNELNARASGLIVEAGPKLVSMPTEAKERRLEFLIDDTSTRLKR